MSQPTKVPPLKLQQAEEAPAAMNPDSLAEPAPQQGIITWANPPEQRPRAVREGGSRSPAPDQHPAPQIQLEKFGGDPRRQHRAVASPAPEPAPQAEGAKDAPLASEGADEVAQYEFPQRREFALNDEVVLSKRARNRQRLFHKNVKVSFIIESAEAQAHAAQLFSHLPFFAVFLILVLVELFISRDTDALYWSTANVGNKLATMPFTPISVVAGPYWGKTFMDIRTTDDWYQWLQTTVPNMLWDNENPNLRVYENNVVSGNNIKIGSMRLRVVRVTGDSCSLNKRWIPRDATVFPQYCFDHWKEKPYYNKTAFNGYRYDHCSNAVLRRIQGKVRSWACSGTVYDIPFSLSRNSFNREVSLLTKNQFVEPKASRFVVVSVITYNAALDMFSLAQPFVELTEGGTLLPQVRTIQFTIMRTQDKVMTILLLLIVLVMTFLYFQGLAQAVRQEQGIKYFVDLWNLLSLMDYIIFYIVLGVRFAYWNISTRTQFQFDNAASAEVYRDELEYVAVLYDQSLLLYAAVTALTCLTIQKFLSLNPRLNILTRTLSRAQQDVVGLLALFVTVLLAYSITGNALFGAGIEDYRNIEVAFSSLMRTLIGDVDYDALKQENYVLAGIFFWSFMLLGLFLLLNFIIAVLGNAFDEENEGTKARPLYDEVADFLAAKKRAVKSFFRSPSGFMKEQRELAQKSFAKSGKFLMIATILRAYRRALPVEDVPPEDFAVMLPEEQEEVMPDPAFNRHTLDDVIREAPDGAYQWAYLTESFLDEFWLETATEYEVRNEDELNLKIRKRLGLMEQCAEGQLKAILGLSATNPLSPEEQSSLVELFAPTKATLDSLEELQQMIESIENTTTEVSLLLCQLDGYITSMSSGLVGEALVKGPGSPAGSPNAKGAASPTAAPAASATPATPATNTPPASLKPYSKPKSALQSI